MLRSITVLSLLFAAQVSWAQRFEPITHPVGLAEKIIVRGFKGNLQLVSSPNSENIVVQAEKKGKGTFDRWKYQIRNQRNTVEIFIKGASEQEDFEKQGDDSAIPEFNMKITAPLRPTEIYWARGSFSTEKWATGLSLNMTNGKVKLRETKGSLNLQLVNGRIDIAKHQGGLQVQTFKGKVNLKETKGPLVFDNHSAIFRMEKHEGPVEISNHSGLITMTEVNGSSQVRNVSGAFTVRKYTGSFDGQFSKGALDARFLGLQSFRVNSDEADITLDAPKESGAIVSVKSQKGRIWTPQYLGKRKKGTWTERRGRLKGKEQGNIKIISKYGDIVLK